MDTSGKHLDSLSEDGRYRLLVEAVTDYAIYMLDPTGIVTSWNAGAERFKGYTAAEIIGQHFSRFYTQEDLDKNVPAQVLETAAREGKFEAEGWRVRKDGTRFWAYVVVDPIRSAAGEIVGFAKITRDLTERKAAEDELRKSQEQFRLLVQGVTDYAIYMLDRDGRVSSWNLGAERIKGYLPREIIGSHFSRFYTEEDRAAGAPDKALETAERDGRFEKEGWRVRKDGSRFWAHVVIDAVRDDHDVLIGFAKITRDVTERREVQQQLEKAREFLTQSQKMEAIGQLTGGVAHDFNNLLMAVLGSLDLMRKRLPDDPKLRALLENAVQGAQRGRLLTQRMLAFARRQELKKEAVDLPTLVRGMTDLLQHSLGPAVGIETRFPLVTKPVLADPNQLEMALLNLAVNARDAMEGGGEIIISTREETVKQEAFGLKAGSYICLSISDTGTGMDEATLARAMEPFYTTKGIGKGTGLGLSMVHGMAEQSGGSFTLKSKPDKGTIAELRLPVALNMPVTEPVPIARTAEPLLAESLSLTILAVDDDPLVLTNTIAMLEDLGHTAIAAASGEDALRALHELGRVDLVITDQAMPQMTGAELADVLRAERPGLPVIIATGFAELEPGFAAGLPRLAKPFSEFDLAREIALLFPPSLRTDGAANVVPLRAGGTKPGN